MLNGLRPGFNAKAQRRKDARFSPKLAMPNWCGKRSLTAHEVLGFAERNLL